MFPVRTASKRRKYPVNPIAPAPRVSLSRSSVVAVAGTECEVTATGEVFDGESVYAWSLDTAPDGMEITGSGQSISVTWTPSSSDVSTTPYTISVILEDSRGFRSSALLAITVTEEAESGLSAEWMTVPTGAYSLTDDALDWMAWARSAPADVDRKDDGDLIDPLVLLTDSTTRGRVSNSAREPKLEWTDGDTGSGVASHSGHEAALVRWSTLVAGEREAKIEVAASDEEYRDAYLFCGMRLDKGTKEQIDVVVSMDDGSEAKTLHMEVEKPDLTVNYALHVRFKAASAGKTLSIHFKQVIAGNANAIFLRGLKVVASTAESSLNASPDEFDVEPGAKLTTTLTLANPPAGTNRLTCQGTPATGSFTDNADNTGVFVYDAPDGATGTIGLLFQAFSGQTLLASLARTITHVAVVPPPALSFNEDHELVEGVQAVIALSATTTDTGSLLTFSTPGPLPKSATLVSFQAANSATAEFRWTPESGTARSDPYEVPISVKDAAGRETTGTLKLTVQSTAATSLTVAENASADRTKSPPDAAITAALNTLGPTNWTFWGSSSNTSIDYRSAAGAPIAATFTADHWTRPGANAQPHVPVCTWSGGTPTPSQSGTDRSLLTREIDSEFTITVPIGPVTDRDVYVFFGHKNCSATLTATLSNNGGSVSRNFNKDAIIDNHIQRRVKLRVTGTTGTTLTIKLKKTAGAGPLSVAALAY